MTVKFIAEISSNHNKNIERCFKLIETAAAIGCDGVKFQLFKIDQLFHSSVLEKSEMHRNRREWELPVEFLPRLKQACDDNGIDFSCTPFYLEAVEELKPYVDFYKVASYELLWLDLFRKIRDAGKPVVLSTGMANIVEVERAVQVLKKDIRNIIVLHCVSSYPAPLEECNLQAIQTIRNRIGGITGVGWSDHTVDPFIIQQAILPPNYADMVEFHLDLEGDGVEYDIGHCWLPDQAAKMIEYARLIPAIAGHGEKVPAISESPEIVWRADPTDGLRPMRGIR